MRRHALVSVGVCVLGLLAVIGPLAAQQQGAQGPAPAAPAPPAPPRENQPGGLAGAVSPSTPAIPYPAGLTGEKDFVVGVLPPFTWGPIETPKPKVPAGFTPIFNGVNLTGWHPSQTNLHGTAPHYWVLDGAIVATQDPPGQGGILLTDKSYRNFELYMEVKPDYGCDSGIFFRSTESGHAYQVTMDYLPGGSMGSLILEGIASPARGAAPNAGRAAGAPAGAGAGQAPAAQGQAAAGRAAGAPGGRGTPVVAGIPLGATTANGEAPWMKVWKREAWNTVRLRVEGDIPHVQVWINDVLVTDVQETTNRAEGGIIDGPIAIQVHGGSRWIQAGFWRWRNIGIKTF
jgi:hypothetical protein